MSFLYLLASKIYRIRQILAPQPVLKKMLINIDMECICYTSIQENICNFKSWANLTLFFIIRSVGGSSQWKWCLIGNLAVEVAGFPVVISFDFPEIPSPLSWAKISPNETPPDKNSCRSSSIFASFSKWCGDISGARKSRSTED